jgi:hypothetical protein
LHKRDLDGVGVFEDREGDGEVARAAGLVCAQCDALFLVEFVEVAEAVAAQGGRSALGAVDFEMLTAIWEIWHGSLLESFNVSEFQGFEGETLRRYSPEASPFDVTRNSKTFLQT